MWDASAAQIQPHVPGVRPGFTFQVEIASSAKTSTKAVSCATPPTASSVEVDSILAEATPASHVRSKAVKSVLNLTPPPNVSHVTLNIT